MEENGTGSGARRNQCASIVEIVDRATRDRGFRAELRRDPIVTAEKAGLTFSTAEWAGLRDVLSG